MATPTRMLAKLKFPKIFQGGGTKGVQAMAKT